MEWLAQVPKNASPEKKEAAAGLKALLQRLVIPEEFPLIPGEAGRKLLERTSFGFEGSMIMLAAGAIMGIRVGVSLLIGAILYFGVIGTILVDRGITEGGYGPVRQMDPLALHGADGDVWIALLRPALADDRCAPSAACSACSDIAVHRADPLAHVEVPGWWFVLGTATSGLLCMWLGRTVLRHSLVDGPSGGAGDLRAVDRGGAGDRRDRRDADRRHGQDHAAHVRRHCPVQHHDEPDDGNDHGGGRRRIRPTCSPT